MTYLTMTLLLVIATLVIAFTTFILACISDHKQRNPYPFSKNIKISAKMTLTEVVPPLSLLAIGMLLACLLNLEPIDVIAAEVITITCCFIGYLIGFTVHKPNKPTPNTFSKPNTPNNPGDTKTFANEEAARQYLQNNP